MAFFKFRKGESESVTRPTPSESVEAMRRRARQRLIGAAVLVLAGIVGFPLLFDSQPRPVAVDIPIEIPDRQKSPPLADAPARPTESPARPTESPARPAAPVTSGPVAAPAATPAAPTPSAAAPTPSPAASAQPASQPPVTAAVPSKPASPPSAPANAANPATAGDEAARARALLEGRTAAASADNRFVVQVGAFAEAAKAREVRQRLERAGVKTYVHVAETKDGPRIRVRVGPFTNRAEADKAVQKIKGLDLPAAILTL